ncbi:MAG: nucleoside triphosphate pyrophosphohydrolase [Muribaculaceae bacterium]|nr:nucleoside triphosphate pyrophosphohydrolase [Muribaculaceae bacterium]MDE6702463.1 nucleoside triphosphate pyrophosphohydrolase [Muribaculaceae bacterium]
MSNSRDERLAALGKVIDTLDILRVRCPWDAKQTNESLRPNTIEEVYELAQALVNDDTDDLKKELGDVLLHILFYSKIADEKGQFDIADVANALNDKLIFRHPHVFGEVKVGNSHDVETNWEKIKLKEKGGNRTVLAGVPDALPALIKSFRIQEKAANVGFDWERREDVWEKVCEEIDEVSEAMKSGKQEDIEAEFGDLMFSIVNAARLYGVNPENALERTNRKFIKRFNHIEKSANDNGRKISELTLDEMEALWSEAKNLK